MTSPLIKICGVRSPELARDAAKAGAQFIGMVFHPQSIRYVNTTLAASIALAASEYGAEPVGVFVNHTAQQIEDICLATHIKVIQLHGDIPRSQHHLLPAYYQRIYVRPVTPEGTPIEDKSGLLDCDVARDFLLFDNIQAGKGQPFDWSQFHYHGPFRLALAGGLTAANVTNAIQKFQPAMVDVSGGVESAPGVKDIARIQQFISTVRGVMDES